MYPYRAGSVLAALFLAILLLLVGAPARAAGILVNSADDTVIDDDGKCTLREAIINANNDTAPGTVTGECAAGSAADAITFAANYTITLAGSQLPAVTTVMTITGNGPANTIIQASTCNPVTLPGGCTPATYRVFEVGTAGDLTLDGLTVRHGRCAGGCETIGNIGGGILNSGTLAVTNSALSGNTASFGGGILNDGTVTVTNSTLSGNSANYGGGIFNNTGTATVTNSTLSGNSAPYGGGIHNSSTANVTNSTLAGNSASSYGGGIYNHAGTANVTHSTLAGNSATTNGGGILIYTGTANVTNSTLSGNSATNEGGGIRNHSTANVTNSTLSGNSATNGGGIHSSFATANVTNSLFVAGASGGNCLDVNLGASNIADDASCGSATQKTTAEINLGPLADNGGPTETHALLPGSHAIDFVNINATACANAPVSGLDQRGVTRPGAACDAGAFEVATPQAGPGFVVNDAADTDDGACDALVAGVTECTLREAINAANAQAGANTITFLADYTITLAGSQLPAVTTEMIITGNGAANTIIQASTCNPVTLPGGCTPADWRVFQVGTAGNLTLEGVTVRHGRCAVGCATFVNGGGGILNLGALAVTNSTLSGNSATGGGGGIGNTGTATLTNSTFSGNSANNGGGIYNNGTATVTNNTLSGNSAGVGGGIVNFATAIVTNSTFSGNSASVGGGGIFNIGTANVTNSLFVAGASGGNCSGMSADASNIADDASCGSATQKTTAEIALGPLQNNGGPTETHALLPGSAAINKGENALAVDPDDNPLLFDQRGVGFPRILGGVVDVGAFEAEPPPADPCAPVAGNIIANFCFQEGGAPWQFWSDGQGDYNVSPVNPFAGIGAAEIQINVPGSNVQFYQAGLTLQPNTAYELSFAAYSNNGRDMSLYLHKHGSPYTGYGLTNRLADLTTSWQVFTMEFTTPNLANMTDGRLRFWFAPFDAAGTVYHIDRVVLRPAGGPPLPPDPDPTPPQVPPPGHCNPPVTGNLVVNPGYESNKSGWTFWTDAAGTFTVPVKPATTPYECSKNARVAITTPGTNVQLYQTGFNLKSDTTYRLRLAARSSGGQDMSLFIHRHSAPYTNYGLNGAVLNLSNSWQVFVVQFTTNSFGAATTDTRLRFWLAPFDAAGAVYQFDDVVLTEVAASATTATTGEMTAANGTEALRTLATSRPPALQVGRQANALLVDGYFIDDSHADRTRGGYVGANASCRNPRTSLTQLWPVNGKLWVVNITGIGSPRNVTIDGVWQDEPVGPQADAVIRANKKQVELRAERDEDASADGRVYTIRFTATYPNGQVCQSVATIGAPLSIGQPAVSGGEPYNSLTP